MTLIEMIKLGKFRMVKEPGDWNRMGNYMMEGATAYHFENDVKLYSYNGTSWLLRIAGALVRNKPSDDQINDAFEVYRSNIAKQLKG